MTDRNHTDDVREELKQDNDGFCTLQVRAKRGEGTRDEDRVTATLGRPSLDEVEADRGRFLDMVEDSVERTREMQPGEDENDEDGEGGE